MALLDSGESLPKNYISFEEKVNSLGLVDRLLIFKASPGIKIIEFNIVVKAYVDVDSDGQKKVTSLLNVKIRIIDTSKFAET